MKNTLLYILIVLVMGLMLSGCYYDPYYATDYSPYSPHYSDDYYAHYGPYYYPYNHPYYGYYYPYRYPYRGPYYFHPYPYRGEYAGTTFSPKTGHFKGYNFLKFAVLGEEDGNAEGQIQSFDVIVRTCKVR